MRGSLVHRIFLTLYLARDTWITVAIATIVLVLIRQGRELIGEVAVDVHFVWAVVGTTFWSVAALYFTHRCYHRILPERHRIRISDTQAVAMAFVAGLVPIAFLLTAMFIAVPDGVVATNRTVVPTLSFLAYLTIGGVSLAARRWRHAPDVAALGRAPLLLFLVPAVALFVLGFFRPIETARLFESYPLFAIWCGTATAVLYYIRSLSEHIGLPLTAAAVALMLVAAAMIPEVRHGHEIRTIASGFDPKGRANLATALQLWQASQPGTGPTTMVLVAAPGGGIVSAMWTAISLSRLREHHDPMFARDLFAISSVSGGSLGAALYVDGTGPLMGDCLAAPPLRDDDETTWANRLEGAIQEFASVDHVAAVAMRLIFLNDAASPYFAIGPFSDRSVVLEQSWEQAWQQAVANQKCQTSSVPSLSQSFLSQWYRAGDGGMSLTEPWQGIPYLLLNGMSLTSGRRMVTSPFVFPAKPEAVQNMAADMASADIGTVDTFALDLLGLSSFDMRISTTANNSARFPWIEPGGRLTITTMDDAAYTFDLVVDGAYFDSSGAQTLRDLIAEIVDTCQSGRCRPIRILVIQLSSDPGATPIAYAHNMAPDHEPPGLWNAFLTPVYGGLISSKSHTSESTLLLRSYVEALPVAANSPVIESLFVELPFPSVWAPLGWVVSHTSSRRIVSEADLYMSCALEGAGSQCSILASENIDGPPKTSPDAQDLISLRHVVLQHGVSCIDAFLAERDSPVCGAVTAPE